MTSSVSFRRLGLVLAGFVALSVPVHAVAEVSEPRFSIAITPFVQGMAEAAAQDQAVASFYRERGYAPIWTGSGAEDSARRAALLAVLQEAGRHGLPVSAYDPDGLRGKLRAAVSERELGRLEVEISRLFVRYAHDVQTGVLDPGRVIPDIKRDVPLRDPAHTLEALVASEPLAYMHRLAPHSDEYVRLMRAKLQLERDIADGGWGRRVEARKLEPGDSGPPVVALRDRLVAMGHLRRSASARYDAALEEAVRAVQRTNGLNPDGIAGPVTLAAINVEPMTRLKSVMVAMERERWMNMPRGARHVWVNIPEFKARIIDDGKVTFETRAVVGQNRNDQRTPEFSDMMEHMVVNPTWNVPRSIAVKEYLPALQANPLAAGHLRITDRRGLPVDRMLVDFTQFTASNFPFDLKQPPSTRNALGLVKFMFPNRWNIYLHDTPTKHLFDREVRAFSHGCIRLADPFDFAYALLSRQTDDPQGVFARNLNTGRETHLPLQTHVPVHLVYRTAFTTAKGEVHYRDDIYGRDATIFEALRAAGVVLPDVQS